MEAFLLGLASNFAANLLSSIAVKVTPFLAKNIKALKFDAKVEVEKLEEELANAKNSFDKLRTTETWQRQTADIFGVLCDIEDLMNDLMGEGKSKITKKKIKEVQKRLKRITATLEVGNTAQQQNQNQQSVVADTLKIPKNIVGRKQEMEKIVKLLLDDTISLVNIVGMGGLGKTVLAWHALKDSRIEEKFRVIWVPMSAEFDLNAIAKSILHPRLKTEYPLLLPDNIWGLSKEMYAGKSVLIVLDGLWDVKGEDWRSFSDLFLDTSAGCKVVVTTQNPQVASNTGARRYDLPLMRDEDCRELVVQSALRNKNLDSRHVRILEGITGAVAQMSKGLPLAASNLGHFLASTCGDDDDWMNLKDKYICDTTVFKKQIFPRLKLNTANMSSHLTKCLAYCSLFPHNYHFIRDSLVELWVAAGFIPSEEARSLREIGNEYFDDLYSRSFFQPSQLGDHAISRQSRYKMHEFIHNFAQFIASSVCFRLEDIRDFSSHRLCNKVRHLSLLCTSSVPLDLQELLQCDGLRTFLLPTEHSMKFGQIPPSFVKLGRLQVLDLSHTDVVKIHESLGELKLLQYLELSKTNIELLPKSISKLYGLQVLKLRGCTKLLHLPTDLYSLISLVNLEVDMPCLASKAASVGSLIYLQTLPKFFVGTEKGSCITELKNLKFLRGTINLLNLENVKGEAKAREANLNEKQSLRRLELEWSGNIPDEARARAIDVLAGLEPHPYVEELKVTNYVGSSFPTWLTSQSCTLVSIYVQVCSLDDVLPTLGQLPFLKNLYLKGMHRVTEMRNPAFGDGAYPSLKSLEIIDMRSLKSWHELPDDCMLNLTDLKIIKCPSLISMQSLNPLSSLQILEIESCPSLEALPQLPSSMQSLIISQSNVIKRRCEPGGPEWEKIRSIPKVEIDWRRIVFP